MRRCTLASEITKGNEILQKAIKSRKMQFIFSCVTSRCAAPSLLPTSLLNFLRRRHRAMQQEFHQSNVGGDALHGASSQAIASNALEHMTFNAVILRRANSEILLVRNGGQFE